MTIMMHATLRELAPESDGKRSWGAHQTLPRSQAGRMSLKMTTLVAGVLAVFAVVHVVGGTLLMARADQPLSKTEALVRGD
jgi:hypothetical protein